MSRWRARAIIGLVLAVLANVVLGFLSNQHDAVVVTLIVLLCVAGAGLLLDALASVEPAAWSALLETTAAPEREDGRLASYRHLLERHRHAREPDTALQKRLVQLADQHIGQVYGVRLATDPERARALLGPDLVALAEAAPDGRPRRLTIGQIDHLIDRIEHL